MTLSLDGATRCAPAGAGACHTVRPAFPPKHPDRQKGGPTCFRRVGHPTRRCRVPPSSHIPTALIFPANLDPARSLDPAGRARRAEPHGWRRDYVSRRCSACSSCSARQRIDALLFLGGRTAAVWRLSWFPRGRSAGPIRDGSEHAAAAGDALRGARPPPGPRIDGISCGTLTLTGSR